MGTTSSDTGRDRAALADPVARTGLPEPASPAPAERPASPEAAPPAGPPAPEPGSATGSATGSAPVAAPAADGAENSAPPRRAVRVIRNADTMEIPVHLLFREEADGGEGARDAGRPADPFAPRPAPEAAFRTVAAPHRGSAGAHRSGSDAPRGPLLCPPALDESVPAEHAAPSLPGSLAVAVAAGGAAGAGGALWWGGLLPAVAWLPPAGAESGGAVAWVLAAGAGAVTAVSLGGLARGRTGWAWVQGRFGRYRGTVRRTGLVWLNPLAGRCRMDLRPRHWRSAPLPAVDADGVAVEVVLHVVWRVADTARAATSRWTPSPPTLGSAPKPPPGPGWFSRRPGGTPSARGGPALRPPEGGWRGADRGWWRGRRPWPGWRCSRCSRCGSPTRPRWRRRWGGGGWPRSTPSTGTRSSRRRSTRWRRRSGG
ncbi:conserved hypothetical protein [Streptomyces albidoflavus]|nr:conserved hypothetical protein [Streptomyces albidoflavus]